MASATPAALLRFTKFFLAISLFSAVANIMAVLYDSGYVTGRSILLPANTVTLQLNLGKPYRNAFQSFAHNIISSWQNGALSDMPLMPRPKPFVPDSLAPRFNQAGFELLTNTNQQVLRYQEPSLGRRLALLWLGASHSTMALSTALALAGITGLLWQLVRGVRSAAPFTHANARRLRQIGFLVLAWIIWQELAHVALALLIPSFPMANMPFPVARYVELNGDSQTPNLLVFIIISIIAVVYRRGVELQQEAELTV